MIRVCFAETATAAVNCLLPLQITGELSPEVSRALNAPPNRFNLHSALDN